MKKHQHNIGIHGIKTRQMNMNKIEDTEEMERGDAMKIYEILGMIYFRFCQTLPPNRQFTPKLGDSHTKRTYCRETCCQRSPPTCSFNTNEGQENKQKSIKHYESASRKGKLFVSICAFSHRVPAPSACRSPFPSTKF